jgi:hypothetical protein
MTDVHDGVEGGMSAVQEALVVDEPRWWHQGCVADCMRASVKDG